MEIPVALMIDFVAGDEPESLTAKCWLYGPTGERWPIGEPIPIAPGQTIQFGQVNLPIKTEATITSNPTSAPVTPGKEEGKPGRPTMTPAIRPLPAAAGKK